MAVPEPPAPRAMPWLHLAIGAVVTALIVAVFAFHGHIAARPSGRLDPAYLHQVRASATRVLEADTMMAGSVIYVDGAVANLGPRAVTAVEVRLRFKDPYGQLVQEERSQVIGSASGPLPPGATRTFRLGFDHVSAQWNQAPPEIQVLSVFTR